MSKLTTDVVTYCTEASNQKPKYAYRKIFFYKKSTAIIHVQCSRPVAGEDCILSMDVDAVFMESAVTKLASEVVVIVTVVVVVVARLV